MNKARPLFFLLLATTLVANSAFQKAVADFVFPGWEFRCCETDLVSNVPDFLRSYAGDDDFERLLELPQEASLERGNHGPTEDMSSLLDLEGRTLDVLFVGDSTVSWGFDHTQFQRASGLETASLAFGMNLPDEHLATLVTNLARCFLHPNGVVVLSYSWGLLSRPSRGDRAQDRFIVDTARLRDCDQLARAFDTSTADLERPRAGDALWNRSAYEATVLAPLRAKVGSFLPFWSARIGVLDLARRASPEEARKRHLFLRWHPSFRVPLLDQPDSWVYRPLDRSAALREWHAFTATAEPRKLERRRERLARWSRESIGRSVCVALPITVQDESMRYGEWLEIGKSACMIDYAEVVRGAAGLTRLPMGVNQHYANLGGLIMAHSLGRYFRDERVLEALQLGQVGREGAILLRAKAAHGESDD